MASNWSAENASKAYLRVLKMGKRGKEPDVSEFISAMAAGNNAQLMVMVCSSGVAGSTAMVALVAAARQTGGRVVCILLPSAASGKADFGGYADSVEFVMGDAKTLLKKDYKGADFVLIDCNIVDHEGIFRAAAESGGRKGVIVGFNASHKELWSSGEFKAHFLPIGDGLLMARIGGGAAAAGNRVAGGCGGSRKRSRWIVKVDKWTGEEHVFRITTPQIKGHVCLAWRNNYAQQNQSLKFSF